MRTLAIVALFATVLLPAQDPARVIVRVDSTDQAVLITAGPYRVSGMMQGMSHHMGHEQTVRFTWPVRAYLRGYGITIHDAAGRALPAEYLHHAHALDLERRELLTPMFQRLFAAGRETAPVELPRDIGVPLARGDSIALVIMLHSPGGATVEGVYLTLRLPYTPIGRRKVVSVWPMHFETDFVAGEGNAFDLPPGRSVHSAEYTMPVSGRLLAVGGHLHDYGKSLRLVDCESGKTLVLLKGRRDAKGHLISVDRFIYGYNDDGLRLERGHRYRIEAVYENPTGNVIAEGGMGSLGGPLAVEDPAHWPALDRHDPQIALDLSAP